MEDNTIIRIEQPLCFETLESTIRGQVHLQTYEKCCVRRTNAISTTRLSYMQTCVDISLRDLLVFVEARNPSEYPPGIHRS